MIKSLIVVILLLVIIAVCVGCGAKKAQEQKTQEPSKGEKAFWSGFEPAFCITLHIGGYALGVIAGLTILAIICIIALIIGAWLLSMLG